MLICRSSPQNSPPSSYPPNSLTKSKFFFFFKHWIEFQVIEGRLQTTVFFFCVYIKLTTSGKTRQTSFEWRRGWMTQKQTDYSVQSHDCKPITTKTQTTTTTHYLDWVHIEGKTMQTTRPICRLGYPICFPRNSGHRIAHTVNKLISSHFLIREESPLTCTM